MRAGSRSPPPFSMAAACRTLQILYEGGLFGASSLPGGTTCRCARIHTNLPEVALPPCLPFYDRCARA